MSDIHPSSSVQQVAADLAFVRSAVDRRDRQPPDLFAVYLAWAFYIVVGYTLIDVRPAWANLFFAVGWIPAALVSSHVQRRRKARGDIVDPQMSHRAALHWGLGIVLSLVAANLFAFVVPTVRGPMLGQLIVVMIGLVYFLGGVHFDRRFLILGPVMMAGGLSIGLLPYLPWTTLGLVIAAGLIVPSFFRKPAAPGVDGGAEVIRVEP